jgi:hypothetical protein
MGSGDVKPSMGKASGINLRLMSEKSFFLDGLAANPA